MSNIDGAYMALEGAILDCVGMRKNNGRISLVYRDGRVDMDRIRELTRSYRASTGDGPIRADSVTPLRQRGFKPEDFPDGVWAKLSEGCKIVDVIVIG